MIHLTELTGYLASFLVFSTFCVKNILTLRILAISSNLAFIVYAATSQLLPVLVLHTLLLPLNLYRILELQGSVAVRDKLFRKRKKSLGVGECMSRQTTTVRVSLCAPAIPQRALRTGMCPVGMQPVLRKVKPGPRTAIRL